MRREQPRSKGRQSPLGRHPQVPEWRGPLLHGANDEGHLTAPRRIHRPENGLIGVETASANLFRVKRIGIVIGAVALVAALVVGLSQAGGGGGGEGKSAGGACGKVPAALAGAPAPLASLYGQGCELIGGRPAALKARPVD